jgi:hypothetical protein
MSAFGFDRRRARCPVALAPPIAGYTNPPPVRVYAGSLTACTSWLRAGVSDCRQSW